MSTHALRSPSGSSRWIPCPGSVERIISLKASGAIPEDETSPAAEEGTLAHTHLASALMCGFNADLIADPFMAIHVKPVAEYIEDLAGDNEVHVEESVPLFYSPSEHGTIDSWSYDPDADHLHIVDLKYGEGVAVEAVNNTQLAIYAESLIQSLEAATTGDTLISMHIAQPRCREGEPYKVWTTTRRDLQDICEPIGAVATSQSTVISPGVSQCRFCPVKRAGLCAEHAQWTTRGLALDIREAALPVGALPEVGTLTDKQVAAIAEVALRGDFASWLSNVADHALAKSLDVPGYKIVRAKKHKRWADEAAAEKILTMRLEKDQIYTKRMLTPAKAKILLRSVETSPAWESLLEAQIERPEGALTFAPESDKRSAVADEFIDLI